MGSFFGRFLVVEVPHGFYAVEYCGDDCADPDHKGGSWQGVHRLELADSADDAQEVVNGWRGVGEEVRDG